MKINFWFENDQYLNELSDLTEQSFFQGQYSSSCSINQINNGNKNKNPLDEFFMSNNFRKSSEYKKLSFKIEKRKKIDKIKETIFDINKNSNGFIDIKIIGDLLDLLKNFLEMKLLKNKLIQLLNISLIPLKQEITIIHHIMNYAIY